MIHPSNHAITRYWERVKPGIPRNHAKLELCALLDGLEPRAEAPKWCDSKPGSRRAKAFGYVEPTDGIAFACTQLEDGNWIATTCLIRSGKVARQPKPYKHEGFTSREKRLRRNEQRRAA